MEPGDKAINEYLSFEPASFDFLNRFEVQQHEIWEDTYSSRYTLSVEIWLSQYSSDEPHPQLRLRFEEVKEYIHPRQSWENLVKTHFNVMRRMSQVHFEQVMSWAGSFAATSSSRKERV